MNRWIFLLHTAATGMMIGVIWFVQIVHYPMFSLVGRAGFSAYEAAHSRRTTVVVALPMLVELATGAYLVLWPPPGVPRVALWVGLDLIGVIWLSTWLLQVPQHRVLEAGFDPGAHRVLVGVNPTFVSRGATPAPFSRERAAYRGRAGTYRRGSRAPRSAA